MMAFFEVVIQPSAVLDIQQARAYYRARSSKAVMKRNAEIDAVVTQISKYPLAYSVRRDGNRRYNLKIFPFALYYTVDEAAQKINVHAFVHISRNYPQTPENININEPETISSF